MKWPAHIVLLGALFIMAGVSAEQAKEPEPKKATSSEQVQEQTQTSSPVAKKKRNKRDDDVFNPSEEISEDYAVSFPVDI